MKTVFGVVEWIDNNSPILDGMSAFLTKEEALDIAEKREAAAQILGIYHNYTVVRIYVQEGLDERS